MFFWMLYPLLALRQNIQTSDEQTVQTSDRMKICNQNHNWFVVSVI
jgi:hypothetical protein